MKETNKITVTYDIPKKYYFVIKLGKDKSDIEFLKVCDTYEEAVKCAHQYNYEKENNKEYYYIVAESKYYTGSKQARFYGVKFEENNDNEDIKEEV